MSDWLLEVTDLKQYACCPRIVFYRYCLPKIRPVTVLMEEGIRQKASCGVSSRCYQSCQRQEMFQSEVRASRL